MNDQARYVSAGLRYPKFKRHFSEFIGIRDNGHLWVEGCDVVGEAREIPKLVRGDLIALIDTGAYSESRAANFNAQLRPATVLVSGADAEITTERERLSDVAGRFRAPARLLAESFAAR